MRKSAAIPCILAVGVATGLYFILAHGSRVIVRNESATPFSGLEAYSHVERLVGLGPRWIGSDSIAKAREYISSYLSGLGLQVSRDAFSANYLGQAYAMENIIAVIPGRTGGIIAVGGHYDTRLIPGANDGGSSSGLLLELARVLATRALNHTVWIVFFDGEDVGDDLDTMFYGSRYLAERVGASAAKPEWLILPDMIGDRHLTIRKDTNSDERLVAYVWEKAKELGYGRHFKSSTTAIMDDHVPFMEIGIPSCLLIDFKYGPLNSYWHTAKDDLDKIDARSLKAVGDVIYKVVEGLDSGELAAG